MIPLPQSKLTAVAPIIEQVIVEMNCSHRTDLTYCMERLAQGYITQSLDAYVDNVESPRHLAIFGRYPGFFTKEENIYAHLVYAPSEDRVKSDVIAAFKHLIAKYCEVHRRDAIVASSWEYRGSRGIGSFWRSLGFERQEVVYVKHLKN